MNQLVGLFSLSTGHTHRRNSHILGKDRKKHGYEFVSNPRLGPLEHDAVETVLSAGSDTIQILLLFLLSLLLMDYDATYIVYLSIHLSDVVVIDVYATD